MKALKRTLLGLSALLLLLVLALLINTLRFRSRQIPAPAAQAIDVDEDGIAQRLAQALRFKTVSLQDATRVESEAFLSFHAYLTQAFPRVHAALTRELVNGHSLLYRWSGTDDALRPVLFAAHQDVVPVESEELWKQPPFEGRISDGFIWGRGAMDDKSGLLGILEAVELLLAEGYRPARTFYLAFGHDEELGGNEGAAKIAALLRERKIEPDYVLDEGLIISEDILPVPRPVALVGISSKGYVSLELTVESEGGHSSMPPPRTAIGILSDAIDELEEHPMPGGLKGVARQLFEHIGPELPFGNRLVFANLWLFAPMVERQLTSLPSMNAGLRTTTAVTMIEGGLKENVLPIRARAVVNFRILPGDSIEGVVAHVRDTIDDPRVKVSRYGASAFEPSAISDTAAEGFQALERTIHQVFPDVVVAPSLITGATDARHYAGVARNTYCFLPQRYRPDDLLRYHGTDERISVANYAQCVRFYYQLIRNSEKRDPRSKP